MTSELSDSDGATAVDQSIADVSPAAAGSSRETDLPYLPRSYARDNSEQPDGFDGEQLSDPPVPASDESAVEDGESRQAHFERIEATGASPTQPTESDLSPIEAENEVAIGSGAGETRERHGEGDRDLVAEAHKRDLGQDPATGRYRPAEAETAVRVEEMKGVELARSADPRVDWRDARSGETYDAVGNFPAKHFDRQWPHLQTKIADHLDKADYVPVDVSQFTPEQRQTVREFIDDNGLGPRAFLVGQ